MEKYEILSILFMFSAYGTGDQYCCVGGFSTFQYYVSISIIIYVSSA
jgi:hypothetical protein